MQRVQAKQPRAQRAGQQDAQRRVRPAVHPLSFRRRARRRFSPFQRLAQAHQPHQHGEKQQRVRQVQQQIRGVMPRRIEPEQVAIEHVRDPCDRMPVAQFRAAQRPDQPVAVQPETNPRILRHVFRIVVIHELASPHAPIRPQRRCCQQQRQHPTRSCRRPLHLHAQKPRKRTSPTQAAGPTAAALPRVCNRSPRRNVKQHVPVEWPGHGR